MHKKKKLAILFIGYSYEPIEKHCKSFATLPIQQQKINAGHNQ